MLRTGVGAVLYGFALFLAVGGHLAAQTTTFPVRFDTQEVQAPAILTQTSAFKILTSTHYQTRLALEVTPLTANSIVRIDVPSNDTTVSFKVTALSGRSTVQGGLSIRERVFLNTHNVDGDWNNLAVDGAKNDDLITMIMALQSLQDNLTLTVTTSALHDRLTLFIEMLASRPVTITELF